MIMCALQDSSVDNIKKKYSSSEPTKYTKAEKKSPLFKRRLMAEQGQRQASRRPRTLQKHLENMALMNNDLVINLERCSRED
jgi:hypothetical protein